jgi:[acyl-carrier-protein] S-malonyltransferase
MKTAFIFPAFISEFLGNEIQLLDSFSSNLYGYLDEASVITGDDYSNISLDDIRFTEDELRSQLITYIFSCSLSDVLLKKDIQPDIMAGYSMGLYATLFTGGSISFEQGVELINKAFLISKSAIGHIQSAMGSIIGLTSNEIEELIIQRKSTVEIANTNSVHSHLVTGPETDVHKLLDNARELGALNVSLLRVSTPYHSRMLKSTENEFREYIVQKMKIKASRFPIVSSIDQQLLTSPDQICDELIKNLYTRINWMATFSKLRALGIDQFIECGAGKSLHKIGRFISGEFTIYPMNKVSNLF